MARRARAKTFGWGLFVPENRGNRKDPDPVMMMTRGMSTTQWKAIQEMGKVEILNEAGDADGKARLLADSDPVAIRASQKIMDRIFALCLKDVENYEAVMVKGEGQDREEIVIQVTTGPLFARYADELDYDEVFADIARKSGLTAEERGKSSRPSAGSNTNTKTAETSTSLSRNGEQREHGSPSSQSWRQMETGNASDLQIHESHASPTSAEERVDPEDVSTTAIH